MSASSAAFTAYEAIESGEWDDHLDRLFMAINHRRRLYDLSRHPTEVLPPGQVWVAMNGPGRPHWEPRGTGVVVPEHLRRRPKTDD